MMQSTFSQSGARQQPFVEKLFDQIVFLIAFSCRVLGNNKELHLLLFPFRRCLCPRGGGGGGGEHVVLASSVLF